MTVISIHPGITRAKVDDSTGWPVRYLPALVETPEPTRLELEILRALHARTRRAHERS